MKWLCRLLLGGVILGGCGQPPAEPGSAALTSTGPYEYVGSAACAGCHRQVFDDWTGSHHQLAMQLPDAAVLQSRTLTGGYSMQRDAGGAWQVSAADGRQWPLRYLFGHEPLQQYLLDNGGGRLQAFDLAWDSRPERGGHFSLQPGVAGEDDVLHWLQPGQNWNYMCADCHSTAVRKNYDPEQDSYATAYAEISVGCEACHGGGSRHIQWAQSEDRGDADQVAARQGDVNQVAADIVGLSSQAQQLNTCAQCHSRRGQLAEGFSPRGNFLDYYSPQLLRQGLYHPDGQVMDEVYVYGSFLQSRMARAGVTCGDCHSVHSARLKLPGNQVCTQCHNPAGNPRFPQLVRADYNNPLHHQHREGSPGSACVDCHMMETVYMQIDGRRDHSFRIPRPDLSLQLGVPNACRQCHQQQDNSWLADAYTRWYGAPAAHGFAALFAAGRNRAAEAEAGLAALAADPDRAGIVRGTALLLLGGYQRHVSARVIQAGLRDADPLVRLGAVEGAGRFAAAQRWRLLQPMLNDELLAVRMAAVRSLVEVMPELTAAARTQLTAPLAEYRSTLALNEDRAEGQTSLAALYQAQGHVADAEGALSRAQALNPMWVPAYVNMADLYRATGRDAAAGQWLDKALAVDPDLPDVLLAKALWLVRRQQHAQALPLLQRAHELAPGVAEYLYVYAVALHSNRQSAAALQLLEQAIAENSVEQLVNLALSIARDSGDMAALSRLLGAAESE